MQILVIEDNQINMKFISEVLGIAGYSILEANNAQVGIDMAREYQPPLIIMDIQLPGMDGIEATKILKGDEKTSHIKILATTAHAMESEKQKILSSGCDDYISKPLDYKEFIARVHEFMANVPK